MLDKNCHFNSDDDGENGLWFLPKIDMNVQKYVKDLKTNEIFVFPIGEWWRNYFETGYWDLKKYALMLTESLPVSGTILSHTVNLYKETSV